MLFHYLLSCFSNLSPGHSIIMTSSVEAVLERFGYKNTF